MKNKPRFHSRQHGTFNLMGMFYIRKHVMLQFENEDGFKMVIPKKEFKNHFFGQTPQVLR